MQLKTRRLLLREWREEDKRDLVEGLNQISVAKWLAYVPHPYTEKDALDWISYCNQVSKKDNQTFHFAIELIAENKVIGGTSIERVNRIQGTANGGIWINLNYHGQGFGIEAFNKRAEFAFKELGLRRLDNGFIKGNISSLEMQKKIGYRVEEVSRERIMCKATGKIVDEVKTVLLKEEWLDNNLIK